MGKINKNPRKPLNKVTRLRKSFKITFPEDYYSTIETPNEKLIKTLKKL